MKNFFFVLQYVWITGYEKFMSLISTSSLTNWYSILHTFCSLKDSLDGLQYLRRKYKCHRCISKVFGIDYASIHSCLHRFELYSHILDRIHCSMCCLLLHATMTLGLTWWEMLRQVVTGHNRLQEVWRGHRVGTARELIRSNTQQQRNTAQN